MIENNCQDYSPTTPTRQCYSFIGVDRRSHIRCGGLLSNTSF